MTTANLLTQQITLAGLRQQAERLGVANFAKMRKQELLRTISETQKLCTNEQNITAS